MVYFPPGRLSADGRQPLGIAHLACPSLQMEDAFTWGQDGWAIGQLLRVRTLNDLEKVECADQPGNCRQRADRKYQLVYVARNGVQVTAKNALLLK